MDIKKSLLDGPLTRTDELIANIAPRVEDEVVRWGQREISATMGGMSPEGLAQLRAQRDEAVIAAAFAATAPVADHARAVMHKREAAIAKLQTTPDASFRDRLGALRDKDLAQEINRLVMGDGDESFDHGKIAALAAEARKRGLKGDADLAGGMLSHPPHEYDEEWDRAQKDLAMVEKWAERANNTMHIEDVPLLAPIPTSIGAITQDADKAIRETVSTMRSLGRSKHMLEAAANDPYKGDGSSFAIAGRE